jgi:hypothetical protein
LFFGRKSFDANRNCREPKAVAPRDESALAVEQNSSRPEYSSCLSD